MLKVKLPQQSSDKMARVFYDQYKQWKQLNDCRAQPTLTSTQLLHPSVFYNYWSCAPTSISGWVIPTTYRHGNSWLSAQATSLWSQVRSYIIATSWHYVRVVISARSITPITVPLFFLSIRYLRWSHDVLTSSLRLFRLLLLRQQIITNFLRRHNSQISQALHYF